MKIKFYLMGVVAAVFLITTVIGPLVSYARTMVGNETSTASEVQPVTTTSTDSVNSALRQQLTDLMKRVAELKSKLTNNSSKTTPQVSAKDLKTTTGDDEAMSPENEARIAIKDASTAIKQLRSAILKLSDRAKVLEARKAALAATKQNALARRAFRAEKYEEAYRFAMEAKKIADVALAALSTPREIIVCSLDTIICADGTSVSPAGPDCKATCPVSLPAPVQLPMCTMDVMMCPDGTEVGRSGPNCEFACSSRGPASY